jgi:hypothetical protein
LDVGSIHHKIPLKVVLGPHTAKSPKLRSFRSGYRSALSCRKLLWGREDQNPDSWEQQPGTGVRRRQGRGQQYLTTVFFEVPV